jgi:hypothetical protein
LDKRGKHINAVKSQFKQGVSGNPNGRPKGATGKPNLLAQLNILLDSNQELKHKLTGERQTKTNREWILLGQLTKAIGGNTHAFEALAKLQLLHDQMENEKVGNQESDIIIINTTRELPMIESPIVDVEEIT